MLLAELGLYDALLLMEQFGLLFKLFKLGFRHDPAPLLAAESSPLRLIDEFMGFSGYLDVASLTRRHGVWP